MRTAPCPLVIALAAALALGVAATAQAQFAPAGPTITATVGAQSLSAGVGTIEFGGAISIGGSGVALAMTGTATLVNHGSILTSGGGRAIDSNAGIADLTVTNTGLVRSVSGDAFRVNTNSAVTLTNSGSIQVTAGGQAIDWAAITSAPNVLHNLAGGFIGTLGEDAVRPGTNGVVHNAGTIMATPTGSTSVSGSDGIDVRTFSGIQITNSGLISGRHGIATDGANSASSITVTNQAGGIIQALNGSGLNIDGVSANVSALVFNQTGATIRGGVLTSTTTADGDGIDVDGILTLTNAGHILGLGAKGAGNNAEGIAAGGGRITNLAGGRIVGSTLAADAPGGDATRAGNGILIDDGNGGSAVAATTVSNAGLIEGLSGFAIKLVGQFANRIDNLIGGVIRGTGTGAGAAIQTGGGDDTIVHAGTVVGANGQAIDLQGGRNTLVVQGGQAAINGDISGGAGGTQNQLRFDLGSGNAFTYGGTISNFQTLALESGRVRLEGDSDLAGAELALLGGDLQIATPGDLHLRSLSVLADAVIDLGGMASLTFDELGDVTLGQSLNFVDFDLALGHAFRFLGDLSGDGDFLALIGLATINGAGVAYAYDGAYTWATQAMQPVDEPATLAMLGLSLAALAATRRLRRRRQAATSG